MIDSPRHISAMSDVAANIRMHAGYEKSAHGRNRTWTIPAQRGTYGVVESGGVEWVTDDGYDDTVADRIRAATDFLDMHPGMTCVIEVGNSVPASGSVAKRLHIDGRAGEFTARSIGDGLATIAAVGPVR